MDPYEAATQLILKANGSVFQSLHLRVDSVRPTLSAITSLATAEGKSTLPKRREIWSAGKDPKCSLFVGNLDVAANEEDLRLFFEGLVRAERGVRKGAAGGVEGAEGEEKVETEGEEKVEPEVQGDWVLGVRIVRDKESGMGKGFGFVAFAVSPVPVLAW
jgi:nucleolar protein 12